MTRLTSAERALDLFRQRPPVENRIDWLANQLLALATETEFLTLRIVPAEGGERTLECVDASHTITLADPGPVRIFRTGLARLAKMAEEENGSEFTPYGGKLYFDRLSPDGPVRVNVEFRNTADSQSLKLTKLVSA